MQPSGEASRPAVRHAVHRPPTADLLLMPIGVLAVSTSGPLMAAAAAPAIAIAMWRNTFAVAAIAPFAALRHRDEIRSMDAREWTWTLAAGVMLALHFVTWIPSLRLTSVASATAMVCVQPVWVALIARTMGHHVPGRAWLGIFIALVAVIAVTGVDFSVEPRAVAGDLLALAGGVASAFYTVIGGEVRRTVSTTAYTLVCYSACALLMFVACVAFRQQLTGYESKTWLQLLGLTVGAQLLGHSLFNRLLRTTSPTVVSLAILFEVPGAALIAFVFLDQTPPYAVLPAGLALLLGLLLVISARPDDTEAAVPAE
ncbi:MAG: DMT family transporter [Sporichthyaceae bacterium]